MKIDTISELYRNGLVPDTNLTRVIINMVDNRGGNYVGGNAQNTQMGAGQTVTQTGMWGNEQQSKFDELLAAINNRTDLDQDEKDEAIDTLNHLKDSKAKGILKEAKLKAMWELLPAVVKGLTVAGEVFATLHGA